MIDCDRAGVLIERRLDGEASPQDDVALDAHVAGCPSCAALLRAETELDTALAARFAGAAPSAALVPAVRARVAAEAPATAAAWLPDALNAAGLVLSVLFVLPLAAWWGGAWGAAVTVAALALGGYPLLLADWASEAGSAAPDPTS
jgi:predicted anti-sigma-YlaC factor YlaD